MKSFALSATIIILAACSNQKDSASIPVDSTHQEIPEPGLVSQDTSIYVGPIYAFEETSEFYTPLYTYKGGDDIDYEVLAAKLDSLVYDGGDGEESRQRLPFEIAKKYFNLFGLDRISVYDKNGELKTDAVFVRVELYDQVIESQYIAVFKPVTQGDFVKDVAYCTTFSPGTFKSINAATKDIDDKALTAALSKRFTSDTVKVSETKHFQFMDKPEVYSMVETDRRVYLLQTINNQTEQLYESSDDCYIINLTPMFIEMNGKPMLLIEMGLDETDMMWTSVLGYKSKGYEVISGGRVDSLTE